MTFRPPDARLLRTFATVAREGNVSRAAGKLFLSQPAVSLQLKELQSLLQLQLFTRTSTGVVLTREGQALLAHADRALEGLDDFAAAAQRLGSRTQGKLRVGTILDPEFTRLGAFLHELVLHAPDIRPELQHGMSGTTLARLQAGEIDVGYYVGDTLEDAQAQRAAGKVHAEVLTRFTYRVVAPAGWEQRVHGKDWPTLVDLPWILTPRSSQGSPGRRIAERCSRTDPVRSHPHRRRATRRRPRGHLSRRQCAGVASWCCEVMCSPPFCSSSSSALVLTSGAAISAVGS